ncbi:tetratricopeptide repeat protein [Streptomyces sp. NPDC094472]|uniref:tetratricopeptide repeat protein n=1 Tax=Streptomyces sp. NPDC094472 TaxID=3155080 RepID=UPI00332F6983
MYFRGHLHDWLDTARAALNAARDARDRTGEAWSLNVTALALTARRFDEAIDHLEHALTVLRTSGDRWGAGITFDVLGAVQHRLHHHDNAIEHYCQALGAHRDSGNRWHEGETLGHLGDVLLAACDPEAARTRWQQALMVFEELDHPNDEEVRGKLRRLDQRTPDAEPDRTTTPGHVAPTDTNMTPPVTRLCTFHGG